jgi:hypothetical protein
MARRVAVAVGVAFLVACGGSQQKPETPEPEPMVEESEPMPEEPSEEPEEAPPSGPVSEMGDRPPPVPEAWEPSQADCDDLGAKYEGLLLAVEMEKLEKRNLKPKQKEAAEKNVRITAKQGAQNWLQACQEIVGSVQFKPRWDCAFKALTLDRFNGCMKGKFDDENRDQ